MEELIRRQDAINVVKRPYMHDSERVAALRELPAASPERAAACDIDRIIKRLEERKAHILKEFVLAGSTQKVKDISVANINELDGIIAIIKSEVNTRHAAVQEDIEADAAARKEWIGYNTCRFCKGSHMHTCTGYRCPDAEKKGSGVL